MELEFDALFWRHYASLTRVEQVQVNARLKLLADNLYHPSLQARRWSGPDLWYARISRDIRIFFEVYEDYYLIIDVGHHNIERNY